MRIVLHREPDKREVARVLEEYERTRPCGRQSGWKLAALLMLVCLFGLVYIFLGM